MRALCPRPDEHAAIRTDLKAIFVSLELRHSTWVITSLAPGGGEKMSKHAVRSGDIAALLARYNAQGPQALGDLRCRNGTIPSVLKPDLLDKLKARLLEPPPDGGLWTSPKVAAWMAGELGLAAVLPQRGWEALKAIGWSVQK